MSQSVDGRKSCAFERTPFNGSTYIAFETPPESSAVSSSGRSYASVPDISQLPPAFTIGTSDEDSDSRPLSPPHHVPVQLPGYQLSVQGQTGPATWPPVWVREALTPKRQPITPSGAATGKRPFRETSDDNPRTPKRTAAEASERSLLPADSSELRHVLEAANRTVRSSGTIHSSELSPLLETALELEKDRVRTTAQTVADAPVSETKPLEISSPDRLPRSDSRFPRIVPPQASILSPSSQSIRQQVDNLFESLSLLDKAVFQEEDHSPEDQSPPEAFASVALQSSHLEPARELSPRRKSSGGETKLPTAVPNNPAGAIIFPPRPDVEDADNTDSKLPDSIAVPRDRSSSERPTILSAATEFPPLRRQPARPAAKQATIVGEESSLPEGFFEGLPVSIPDPSDLPDWDRAHGPIEANLPGSSGPPKTIQPAASSQPPPNAPDSLWEQFPLLATENKIRINAPETASSRSGPRESPVHSTPPRSAHSPRSPRGDFPGSRPSAEIPTLQSRSGVDEHTERRSPFYPRFPCLMECSQGFQGTITIGICFLCKRPLNQVMFEPFDPLYGLLDRRNDWAQSLLNGGSGKSSSSSTATVGRARGPVFWSGQRRRYGDDPVISSCAKCGTAWHRQCVEVDIRGKRDEGRRPKCRSCGDVWD